MRVGRGAGQRAGSQVSRLDRACGVVGGGVIGRVGAGKLLAHQLENLAVGTALARGQPCDTAALSTGWASLRAWRIRARNCCVSVPGYCRTHSPNASSSAISRSRHCSAWCSASVSWAEPLCCSCKRGAHGGQRVGLEQAHQLADELHLAALAFEVGDALGLGQCVAQFLGQVQARHQVGAQRQQFLAELLQLGAFALEVGPAGLVGALEFGLELQIEFAAFGDELATDVIAFFGFA